MNDSMARCQGLGAGSSIKRWRAPRSPLRAVHEIPFAKMVGTGNDFVIVDARRGQWAALKRAWSRVAAAMCDRRYGIGADGLLLLGPSRRAETFMRIFNADGSEAQMCGNGARCAALYVHRRRGRPASGRSAASSLGTRQSVTLETKAGLCSGRISGTRVEMRMADPTELDLARSVALGRRRVTVGVINTGVPHAVVPVSGLDQIDVDGLGRRLRFHEAFGSRGTNVDFMEEDPALPSRLRVRTYERGVEGETLACGTGAAASAIVHVLRQRAGTRTNGHAGPSEHAIEVETASGEALIVRFNLLPAGRGARVTNVVLAGAVQWICQGIYSWSRKDCR